MKKWEQLLPFFTYRLEFYDSLFLRMIFWWCFKKYAEKNNMAFDKIEV
ncbi:hypothetical protein I593_00339 [Acinetobacter tandoii DSM 14970 = CIP 107469]|uniref:Uncharacterized protein n=1 Tax=Acinetobacter tandoii DSM 14970 = CIP 107469 TaxID=1120927 RepID=R9BFD0_9GAMM|nr:hypothetical protein I593_00339 [Acinetobacter tandoii DSM 14970 = CIP 107469]